MIIFIEFYWFAFVLCISILQTIKMFENIFHIFYFVYDQQIELENNPNFLLIWIERYGKQGI